MIDLFIVSANISINCRTVVGYPGSERAYPVIDQPKLMPGGTVVGTCTA